MENKFCFVFANVEVIEKLYRGDFAAFTVFLHVAKQTTVFLIINLMMCCCFFVNYLTENHLNICHRDTDETEEIAKT